MFENYRFVLPGTNIHLLTFAITAFELIILVYQLLYFFYRPTDKSRLWYVILLGLLIFYNITGGLFPDPRLPVSLNVQYLIAYGSGILMSIYIPFYIYKFLGIKKLRFYAYYGSYYFLLLPFLLAFVVPILATGDIDLSRKLLMIVPILYALTFLFSFLKAITEHPRPHNMLFREKLLGVSSALFFWIVGITLPFFKGGQLLEHSIANFGFLIMTVIFVRSTIIESKIEYHKLVKSEIELMQINDSLQLKLNQLARKLEIVNEDRINTLLNFATQLREPLANISDQSLAFCYNQSNQAEVIQTSDNLLKINECFNSDLFLKGIQPYYNHEQIVNISNFVNDKLVLFFHYAKNKGIKLKDILIWNIYIKADPAALDILLDNLLGNALKYTPSNGNITVTLANSDDDTLSLSVKDDGSGIPSALRQSVFKAYFKANNEEGSGRGLGLALVKNVVQSLGGSVELNSDVNQGAEFIIKLKRYKLSPNENVENHKPKPPFMQKHGVGKL